MNASRTSRAALALVAATLVALLAAGGAEAHAEISPKVSLEKELQLYNLAVPTEREGKTTTQIVLTAPVVDHAAG